MHDSYALPIRYLEDLSDKCTEMRLEPDSFLGMTPPCHKTRGFQLAFIPGQDIIILVCEVCKTSCGGVKVAHRPPLS